MKVDPTKPQVGDVRNVGATAPTTGPAPAARTESVAAAGRPVDLAALAGIPEAELTPRVRATILTLLEEVDRLRRDLERYQERIVRLERLADEDWLLGVYNRRAFMRELERYVAFASRYGAASSVLYIDVNGMKAINDGFGHSAGDAALQQVARVLAANLRSSDVLGRLGGDEFAAILVNADEAAANAKGVVLAAAVEAAPLDWNGTTIALQIAWGAHTMRSGDDVNAALAEADRRMYARKQARAAAG